MNTITYAMPEREYHAHPALSKSTLWRFAKNPWAWKFGPPLEPTAAMRWGSLVDGLLFGGDVETLPDQYPDLRTKGAKEWRDKAEEAGSLVVSRKEMDGALQAVKVLRSRSIITSLLDGAKFQASVFAEAQVAGQPLQFKCRPDIVPGGDFADALADLKTTTDISDRAIAKQAEKFGYHIQAALYLDLWNAVTGENRDRWALIWQESSEPYDCRAVWMPTDWIEAGRAWYRAALPQWIECHETNNFPSPYEDSIETMERPRWADYED